jgi:hypothetical protein
MAKEGFSQIPEEQSGDKKEKEKKSMSELEKNIEQIKGRENKKSWLKEKFDIWRDHGK